MEVIKITTVIQVDESQLLLETSEFSNKTLHNIFTQNIKRFQKMICDNSEEGESVISVKKEEQIFKDDDLSPKMIKIIKSAKKGKEAK